MCNLPVPRRVVCHGRAVHIDFSLWESESKLKIEGAGDAGLFYRPRAGINLHDCGAQARDREQGDHVLPVVFQAEPDVIAALHADRAEMARCTQNQFREFAIADGSVLVDEGDRGRLYSTMSENRLDDIHWWASASGWAAARTARI